MQNFKNNIKRLITINNVALQIEMYYYIFKLWMRTVTIYCIYTGDGRTSRA